VRFGKKDRWLSEIWQVEYVVKSGLAGRIG
jgi:hypothetical protein